MGQSHQSLIFLSLTLSFSLISICASSSTSNLVFKGCADQNFQDSTGAKESLKTLLDALISQSSAAKFGKSASGSPPSAINGLFQCRGDLSGSDCRDCVSRAPALAQKLCGQAIAARVQLEGCYLRYEISGFRQVGGTELLYKVCGPNGVSGSGFWDKLDLALGEISKGVASGGGGGGYYAGTFQAVSMVGQCEGDLSGGDCVSCVKSAIERAKSECATSISAQIYLQACYITYNYYPNGVPTSHQQPFSSSGTGRIRNTQKTVALVLGGLVGVGLVMACLLFTKSAFKKKPHALKFGG